MTRSGLFETLVNAKDPGAMDFLKAKCADPIDRFAQEALGAINDPGEHAIMLYQEAACMCRMLSICDGYDPA